MPEKTNADFKPIAKSTPPPNSRSPLFQLGAISKPLKDRISGRLTIGLVACGVHGSAFLSRSSSSFPLGWPQCLQPLPAPSCKLLASIKNACALRADIGPSVPPPR